MSRTTNPLIPAKPTEITLDTLPLLFAHHRAWAGGYGMTQTPPEPDPPPSNDPPEGVSAEEWSALGDPGKQAILRERNARVEAERALVAARARPKAPGAKTDPPPPSPPAPAPAAQQDPPAGGGTDQQPDLGKLIEQAVAAAVKPFQDREDQREADNFAEKIRSSVIDAAKDRFYDASDALTGIDLTQVTDGTGRPDPAKVTAELDKLLAAKPHLGKPSDGRRRGEPGTGSGGAPSDANIDDRVRASLERMQASMPGVKFASTSTT